jgi:hypothetical protein
MDNPHQAKPSCQRLVSASPRVCLANTTWTRSAGPCAAEPRRRRRWRWRRRCFCCCWVCWVRGARTPAERPRRATAARLPSGSQCWRSPVSTAPGAPSLRPAVVVLSSHSAGGGLWWAWQADRTVAAVLAHGLWRACLLVCCHHHVALLPLFFLLLETIPAQQQQQRQQQPDRQTTSNLNESQHRRNAFCSTVRQRKRRRGWGMPTSRHNMYIALSSGPPVAGRSGSNVPRGGHVEFVRQRGHREDIVAPPVVLLLQ